MKTYRLALLMVVLLAATFVPASKAQDTEAEAALEAVDDQFVAAWNAADAEAVAALYTEDAQLLLPGKEPIVGREAIQEAYQADFDEGAARVKLTTKEIEVHGEMAYTVGEYVNESIEGEHLDHGKYVTIWKKEDGQWRYYRDIVNSSMAPKP